MSTDNRPRTVNGGFVICHTCQRSMTPSEDASGQTHCDDCAPPSPSGPALPFCICTAHIEPHVHLPESFVAWVHEVSDALGLAPPVGVRR